MFISTDAGGLGLNLQAADLVVNLDLPWNPARLEQRIARAHRIGSKGTVQIHLLITRDSIEQRILHLHQTKRNVLENIWAGDGEDVIAAPGGSGAFKHMIEVLLRTRGPEAEGIEEGDDLAAEPEGLAPSEAADRPASPPSVRTPAAREIPAPATAGNGPATPAVEPADRRPPAASSDGESASETTATVDPQALAQAVAAVAPALPRDHRRSLAVVFRTLADVLEGEDA